MTQPALASTVRFHPAERPSTETPAQQRMKSLVRTIPDFPKPGIQFRDITTLMEDRWGFQEVIDEFISHYKYTAIDKIVAIESRGFLIGGAMAHHLNAGLVVARKKGKLPGEVEQQEYTLEYGTDCIEIHTNAISQGERCLVVDDLLATGGTCGATCQLVERLGGDIVGCAFVIDLPDLGGKDKLAAYDVHTLIEFEGE